MKPRVMNRYDTKLTIEERQNAVYIGRPSPWGNPFIIGIDGTREEVIEKYRWYVESQSYLKEEIKKQLKGKNLICFCAPQACHGDILLEIANEQQRG